MTDDYSGASTPTTVLPEDGDRKLTWPSIVGGICIAYALFAFVANACGPASLFVGEIGLQMAGIEVKGGLDLPRWIMVSTVVTGAIGLLLAGLLCIGGIGLIRRKARSLTLLKVWLVAAIVMTVIQIVLGFLATDSNTDLSLRIQDATVDMLRKQNPKLGSSEIKSMGLAQSEEDISSASIRNVLVVGAIPIVYPLVLGFFITSRKRVMQVEGWE
ncbi:MAG: hypothetical protein GY895_00875 [Phycisphaera sp.]|nr:hypothetical protein [Phycisphaera sp.]